MTDKRKYVEYLRKSGTEFQLYNPETGKLEPWLIAPNGAIIKLREDWHGK